MVYLYKNLCRSGGMADAMDSKSIVRKDVRVRVPPSVLSSLTTICEGFFLLVNASVFTVQIVIV